MDGILTGTITSREGEPRSNGNVEVLNTPRFPELEPHY